MDRSAVPDYVDCNEIIGIEGIDYENIVPVEHNIEFISMIQSYYDENNNITTTMSPTSNPIKPSSSSPTTDCGRRGSPCESATACCSNRCNFSTQTCYPESPGSRDKISSGMGG